MGEEEGQEENEKEKRMRRNDFEDGLMFGRSLWIGDQQKRKGR